MNASLAPESSKRPVRRMLKYSIVAVCFSRKMSLMSYFSHKRHHNASQVSSAKLKAATRRVMAHYVRSSYTLLDIPVTEGYCMAALDTHVGDNKRPVIMLMHGFGGGFPLWIGQIDPLVAKGYRVIAMDWLGMGGSSRPPFNKRTVCEKDEKNETKEYEKPEAFFIDALELARLEMKVTNMNLVGHSLGGYLSAQYARKYPKHVKRLMLVSPVGVPIPKTTSLESKNSKKSLSVQLALWAWQANFTPQHIIRALSESRGQNYLQIMLQRRFPNVFHDVTGSLYMSDYLYQISVAQASGEYAMNSLLTMHVDDNARPQIVAREPIATFIDDIKMPKCLLFGDRDWLYHPDIPAVVEQSPSTEWFRVPSAGHHIYFDNPSVFHQHLETFLNQ